MTREDLKSITLRVLRVRQPIGEFFIGVIDFRTLCEIADFDVRRIQKEEGRRDFETYLGIQRPLNPKRVKEIAQYVTTLDACFPTAVILSVNAVCAEYKEAAGELVLSNYPDAQDPENTVLYRQIAKVLDGQHRIDGLREFTGTFDINVCIFVDIDVAEEGYVFSTVNLTQTKVNKSLVYDLFDLARSRSPQKLCHNIAVALDQNPKSPFYERIKRLGVATEGRFNEMLTQATFVEGLMRYISKEPAKDRDLYMRGKTPRKADRQESETLILRNMMIENKELDIADVVWNYFEAAKRRWPVAWAATGKGSMLNKTNGFRGLMRFLKPAYLHLTGPGGVPTAEEFKKKIFEKIEMKDDEFNTDNFKPGTSGEVTLFKTLKEKRQI